MAHEERCDRGRLVIEKRLGYVWAILPESIATQDYTTVEESIAAQLSGTDDRLVVDFINVHALYSSGLGILVRLQKKVGQSGGVIALVNISPTIEDLLVSLHLDRIFPLYGTDVEFEISQEDLWNQRLSESRVDFLFIGQVENNVYRITLSGEMVSGHDLTLCRQFVPDPRVQQFVFDLTGLESMDSSGAGVFMNMLDRIVRQKGSCRAFGAVRAVSQVLTFLGAGQFITFFETEKEALQGLFA